MRKRQTLAIVVLVLGAAAPCSAGQQPASPRRPPTFRSGLDVIAVDVQVVDRDGAPVPGLGPDKFDVTINGRRRRVLSAELVESRSATSLTPEERAAATAGPPVKPTLARVVYIAIDCLSFDPSASRHVIAAAQQFIDRLPPTDEVGLFAYPYGPKIAPTTDHATVRSSLLTVQGQRDLPSHQFHLRPSEIVDLSGAASFGQPRTDALLQAVINRECGNSGTVEELCAQRLVMEISGAALYYEGQGNAGLGMLRSLLAQLSAVNGRKTLVLISAGMIASDVPGGRPNIGELGLLAGKEAARSNTTIYTLFLDTSTVDRFQAEVRGADKNLQSEARDSEVLGRWLDHFSGAAGGALFKVQVGSGELAFDRILREISAYYMLGVEPADEDRDGRAHEIKVTTNQKNLVMRGSRWVVVPKRGAAASPSQPESAAAESKEKPPSPTRPVVAADIQAMADAYDRSEQDFEHRLAETQDLATLVRHFRGSDSPWPDQPRRTAVFALELAVAALKRQHPDARDEGGRLLAEYNARVRQPAGADAFECSWLWTEVAAFEGLFMADSAMLFVPRAVERCPGEGRLQLAYAIISEQQWLRGSVGANEENGILDHYQAAMKSPSTGAEARMRAASFLLRIGRLDEALVLADVRPPADTEPDVLYLSDLVRGQILRARSRPEDAEKAYREALAIWPGAQSARVALMTLVLSRGDRQEAATLAAATETEADGSNKFDPWWAYWLGDYRVFPAIVARLREMAK